MCSQKRDTLEISFILLFFCQKKHFFLIKLGWLIHFLHDTGVFVLVPPLSYYYSIILMESLAFLPLKEALPGGGGRGVPSIWILKRVV